MGCKKQHTTCSSERKLPIRGPWKSSPIHGPDIGGCPEMKDLSLIYGHYNVGKHVILNIDHEILANSMF